MKTKRCTQCGKLYDDARQSHVCPHLLQDDEPTRSHYDDTPASAYVPSVDFDSGVSDSHVSDAGSYDFGGGDFGGGGSGGDF